MSIFFRKKFVEKFIQGMTTIRTEAIYIDFYMNYTNLSLITIRFLMRVQSIDFKVLLNWDTFEVSSKFRLISDYIAK